MKHIIVVAALLLSVQYLRAQQPASARDLFTNACAQAGKEGKNVFVMFHASWCGWCHKMDSSMNDASVRSYFNDSYVILHLTVQESKDKKDLENPGAQDMMDNYGGAQQGLPFWLVFDHNGKLLADSKMPVEGAATAGSEATNVGCPANPKEVAYFISVLQKTSKITPAAAAAVQKRFAKNDSH